MLQRSIRGLRWMLESVREIHGHVNKQYWPITARRQSEKSAKNIDGFCLAILLLDSSKVGQLAMWDRQLCCTTLLLNKVAQLCCVSDIGIKLLLPLHQFPSYLLADKWTCGNRAPIFALSAHKYRLGLFYLNLRDIPCHTSNNTAAAKHTSWFLIEFRWAVMATSKRPNLEPKKPVKWEVF